MGSAIHTEKLKLNDGRSVLIRDAQAEDGELFRAYLTELGASTEYMLTHPEDMRMAGVYESCLSKIDTGGFYALTAIDEDTGTMIGNSALYFNEPVKLSHVAGLAMGVLPDWQGVGLGAWMLKRSIEDMKQHPKIKRLQLVVMDGNDHARRMYERIGFTHEGKRVKAVQQPDGSYRDEFLMAMWVGE